MTDCRRARPEIRDLLADFELRTVTVETAKHYAKVLPANIDAYERMMTMLQTSTLREQKLSVILSQYLLCVAHLPRDCSPDEFRRLVSMHSGTVCRCFLMPSELTGKYKGYGFIEFTTKDAANKVMNALDGWKLRTCTLHCDWLNNGHLTFASIHSRCLFVDELPEDYDDVSEFKTLFGQVAEPTYCQIALKAGNSMGVGLVEFATAEQAERTRDRMNDESLRGHHLRISYSIPGISAAMMYGKLLMSNTHGIQRGSLLPDPVLKRKAAQLGGAGNQPVMIPGLKLQQMVSANGKKPHQLGAPGTNPSGMEPPILTQMPNHLLQNVVALQQMQSLLQQQQQHHQQQQQQQQQQQLHARDSARLSQLNAKPLQPSQQVNRPNGEHLLNGLLKSVGGATKHVATMPGIINPLAGMPPPPVPPPSGVDNLVATQQTLINLLLQQNAMQGGGGGGGAGGGAPAAHLLASHLGGGGGFVR
ncbi:PREDICTED: ribonucleoprotein PTB-binding 1-like [Priapulus caudatus]|uniref:Ribonucleoprotein PTB-binding 1-like n=1 Tax=Priapulus caudatus TaxID=37621 RepID=A0ABM1EDG9_PRICU|nr:PREDICTED: ribonucleoprotein PTB-binding 1-like [Priapulus caudatus]